MHRLSIRVSGSARTVLASLERTLKGIVKSMANPLLTVKGKLKLCRKRYIQARALGREETKRAVKDNIKCVTSHAFTTAIQYCVPVLSAGFLIASVRYTATLQYGADSTYTQESIEDVNLTPLDELQSAEVVAFPKFAFKTIEDSEETFESIIDSVREEEQSTRDSHEGMSEGYGVFVEDEFLGAVLDKSSVEDALTSILNEYLNRDDVTEAHFTQSITYTQGWYTTQYMVDPSTIVATLTGNAKESIYYTVEEGDNLTLISEYANLTLSELLSLNPQITNPDLCYVGDSILVQQAEPFLSVVCTETEVEDTEATIEETTNTDTTDNTYIDTIAQPLDSSTTTNITMEVFNTPALGNVVVDTLNHQSYNGLTPSAPRGRPTTVYYLNAS
jgi:LysM repeat protein